MRGREACRGGAGEGKEEAGMEAEAIVARVEGTVAKEGEERAVEREGPARGGGRLDFQMGTEEKGRRMYAARQLQLRERSW